MLALTAAALPSAIVGQGDDRHLRGRRGRKILAILSGVLKLVLVRVGGAPQFLGRLREQLSRERDVAPFDRGRDHVVEPLQTDGLVKRRDGVEIVFGLLPRFEE
jgi:hypothetical protein